MHTTTNWTLSYIELDSDNHFPLSIENQYIFIEFSINQWTISSFVQYASKLYELVHWFFMF